MYYQKRRPNYVAWDAFFCGYVSINAYGDDTEIMLFRYHILDCDSLQVLVGHKYFRTRSWCRPYRHLASWAVLIFASMCVPYKHWQWQ